MIAEVPTSKSTDKGKFHLKHQLFAVSLVLGLAGCAGMPDLPPNYTLAAEQDEGLAIVSFTLSGKPLNHMLSFEYRLRAVAPLHEDVATVTPRFGSVTQHLRWASQGHEQKTFARNVVVKGTASSEPLDILDSSQAVGRLIALRLPVGEYEIYDWKIMELSATGEIEYSPGQSFSYRFRVNPGEKTYLGRLQLSLNDRNVQKLTVGDHRVSDLGIFKHKYPALSTGSIAAGHLQP